jgi:pimeloyl-[acyl-carrier protein] methyl ester esterase
VDLPGYGHSAHTHGHDLEDIAQQVLESAPERANWLGWSLGGLVATHIAYHHPERVSRLITVASSPKFAAGKGWRGIKPSVLTAFTEQLTDDFQATIERFMALQAMGSPSARQDVKTVKKALLSRPLPNPESLLVGLNILAHVDLRSVLPQLTMPLLRLYGRLDGLVPIAVAEELSKQLPSSEQVIYGHSSHAPFITESDDFCAKIVQFSGK